MDSKIIALLEESIQLRPGALQPTTVLADVGGWDSMGMVMFVTEAFDRVNVELGVEELQPCQTVSDIVALVKSRASA